MLRPSGVSSASEASCAASASSRSATPAAGRNAVAWRLPSVIVPVLSSSSTSTSPAASTARPDMAMTFAWIIRSMPAMPIAESSPPIVVGMRQTRSATSTVTVTGVPWPAAVDAVDRVRQQRGGDQQEDDRERPPAGCSARSRSASSGAWRPRPWRSCGRGTSRRGSRVMRTMSQSESTRVPPVTALRSPPLSRMTGALSPVIALSSTEATPSIDLAVAGDHVAGLDQDDVALPERAAGDGRGAGSRGPARGSFLAWTSWRVRRSASACALPRPSAIASAKLAKSTVNQSQTRDPEDEPGGRLALAQARAWSQRPVVRMLPT